MIYQDTGYKINLKSCIIKMQMKSVHYIIKAGIQDAVYIQDLEYSNKLQDTV